MILLRILLTISLLIYHGEGIRMDDGCRITSSTRGYDFPEGLVEFLALDFQPPLEFYIYYEEFLYHIRVHADYIEILKKDTESRNLIHSYKEDINETGIEEQFQRVIIDIANQTIILKDTEQTFSWIRNKSQFSCTRVNYITLFHGQYALACPNGNPIWTTVNRGVIEMPLSGMIALELINSNASSPLSFINEDQVKNIEGQNHLLKIIKQEKDDKYSIKFEGETDSVIFQGLSKMPERFKINSSDSNLFIKQIINQQKHIDRDLISGCPVTSELYYVDLARSKAIQFSAYQSDTTSAIKITIGSDDYVYVFNVYPSKLIIEGSEWKKNRWYKKSDASYQLANTKFSQEFELVRIEFNEGRIWMKSLSSNTYWIPQNVTLRWPYNIDRVWIRNGNFMHSKHCTTNHPVWMIEGGKEADEEQQTHMPLLPGENIFMIYNKQGSIHPSIKIHNKILHLDLIQPGFYVYQMDYLITGQKTFCIKINGNGQSMSVAELDKDSHPPTMSVSTKHQQVFWITLINLNPTTEKGTCDIEERRSHPVDEVLLLMITIGVMLTLPLAIFVLVYLSSEAYANYKENIERQRELLQEVHAIE